MRLQVRAPFIRQWRDRCIGRGIAKSATSYSAQAFRNADTADGHHYWWRNHCVGDCALGGVNQPCIEVSGTATMHIQASLVESTYRGIRLRYDGSGIEARGCTIYHGYRGVDSVTTNTGKFDVRGCVIFSTTGLLLSLNSSTSAFTGGFAVEHNVLEVATGAATRDKGASNLMLDTLGKPLSDYFVGGDPRNGSVEGSAVVDTGIGIGRYDYEKRDGVIQVRAGIWNLA